MIKLLIVDDSALMRRLLTTIFQAEGDFEIRQARNGVEAVAENLSFEPDVVTLDINMPEMDGITALSLIMAERPVSVVMVSSLTEKGALATFEALNLGAVDYVAKPDGTISLSLERVRLDLLSKVRAAAQAKIRGRLRPARAPAPAQTPALASSPARTVPPRNIPPQGAAPVDASIGGRPAAGRGLAQRLRDERLVIEQAAVLARGGRQGLLLIGVSTGGPRALETLLPCLPADFPWPVLVAQHMPASFTATFAARLDELCALKVVEASRPMPLQAGHIYIGKGGADMVLSKRGDVLNVVPKPESSELLWHPSAELLARSALDCCDPRQLVGVLLTGMGHDGAQGFAEIKKRGGRTIAESKDTAVIFGMPAELIALGGASLVLPLDKVGPQVKAWAAC